MSWCHLNSRLPLPAFTLSLAWWNFTSDRPRRPPGRSDRVGYEIPERRMLVLRRGHAMQARIGGRMALLQHEHVARPGFGTAAVDDFRHRSPKPAEPIGRHVFLEHEIAIAEIGSALVLGQDQGLCLRTSCGFIERFLLRGVLATRVPDVAGRRWPSARKSVTPCRRTRPHLGYAALFGNAHVTVHTKTDGMRMTTGSVAIGIIGAGIMASGCSTRSCSRIRQGFTPAALWDPAPPPCSACGTASRRSPRRAMRPG